jgi:lysophospholipase L1-like esterase
MHIKRFTRIAAALAAVTLFAFPTFAARGTADFTRFQALGDSYGAGFVNGSLNINHQVYAWPAIVARQAGVKSFAIPSVSYPGIGPELRLLDAVSYPPVISPAAGSGSPTNTTYAGVYNNLSIPGANVGDLTKLTGAEANPTRTAEQFARFILRGQGTAVDQTLAAHPTFIAIWIGGNDLLSAVLAGTPAALTPADTFRTNYTAMLDKLTAGAPGAGMIVGSLPTKVSVAPFATTVAPVLINPATRQPVLNGGQPIYFVADLGGGNFGQLTAGDRVLLTASTHLATGYGIPSALKPLFPTLPDVGKPLPDGDVLTKAEIATIEARAVEFNSIIATAAAAKDIPVADITGFFTRAEGGIHAGPFTFPNSFISGGLFGLDGFHMTDLGYTFLANEFIRGINNAYHKDIPFASITDLFQDNGAFFPATTASGAPFVEGMAWAISDEATAQIRSWADQPVNAPVRRLRASNH